MANDADVVRGLAVLRKSERPQRTPTSKELLTEVWDLPPTVQSRAPDQFIHRLRRILEAEPARPRHILTHRDAGYRFDAAGERE